MLQPKDKNSFVPLGLDHGTRTMAKTSADKKPRITWGVERLRLTAFPQEHFDMDDSLSWSALTGDDPEEQSYRPKEGIRREEGQWNDGILTVQLVRDRLDLIYRADIKNIDLASDLPILGRWKVITKIFQVIVEVALDKLPESRRIAFGAMLLSKTKNKIHGYKQLQKLLPNVKLDPERSRDFFYQINRRRTLSKNRLELEINRLSKWSHLRITNINAEVDESGIATKKDVSSLFACRLELDINTSPEITTLPDDLQSLYRELVGAADEIAKRGDIP